LPCPLCGGNLGGAINTPGWSSKIGEDEHDDERQDEKDIIDKENWYSFWLYAGAVWILCLGVLPLLLYMAIRIGIGISGSSAPPESLFRAGARAWIPLGLACWIAFALANLQSMMTFLLQSLIQEKDGELRSPNITLWLTLQQY
jgi:hypothetical protein